MDKHESYDLSDFHRNRYFWPEKDNPARLLKRVRRWIKENDVDVVDIQVVSRWSDEDVATLWEATVLYMGDPV